MDPIHKAIYEMSIVRDKLRLEKLAKEFEEVREQTREETLTSEKETRIVKALLMRIKS
jgi:hypothetical protein